MANKFCISILTLILAAKFGLWEVLARPQVVNLHHPEHANQRQPSQLQPRQPQAKHTARPGSVIVHFDRNHDIQNLQYVLQDGRLASLYQRHPQHPANGRTPTQVPANPQVFRREEVEHAAHVDHDQTIDILDSKLQKVSQLVGDHVTLELPNESGPSGSKSGAEYHAGEGDESSDDKMDILATVAMDAMQQHGAHISEAKLKKAGIILDKLKSKVSQKMHELPGLIERKLREKSSVGKVFLDEAGRRVVIIDDDSKPTEEIQAPSVMQNQNKQPSGLPAEPSKQQHPEATQKVAQQAPPAPQVSIQAPQQTGQSAAPQGHPDGVQASPALELSSHQLRNE